MSASEELGVTHATLIAVCPRHLEDEVARWHLVTLKQTGRTTVWSPTAAKRQLVKHGEVWDMTGPSVAIGDADPEAREPGTAHFREILTCPRPSCDYEAQLRLRPHRDRIRTLLEGMQRIGQETMTVTNIDTPNPRMIPTT